MVAQGRAFVVGPVEAALLHDRDDAVGMNEVFDEAMSSVPMPEPPKSLQDPTKTEGTPIAEVGNAGNKRIDLARFRDFT